MGLAIPNPRILSKIWKKYKIPSFWVGFIGYTGSLPIGAHGLIVSQLNILFWGDINTPHEEGLRGEKERILTLYPTCPWSSMIYLYASYTPSYRKPLFPHCDVHLLYMATMCTCLKEDCWRLGWTDPEEGFAWSGGRISLYSSTLFCSHR